MSNNILNDISKVYLETVAESAVPGKPAERLGAVSAIPQDEREAARKRTLAKAAAIRKKKRIEEATKAKPDYLDFDGDGNTKESMKKALRDKAKQKVEEAKKPNDGNLANNYPPYDKVTRGDIIAGRLGKDQMGGKKKVTKESFSNWRQDLSEVMADAKVEKKISEKKVNNKIVINPKLDLGESVEEMGGTLLEMVEIDEVDYIIESVYDELLDDGYEEDDIEEAIEYALTEAKVTFGHDTAPEKKRSGILDAARKKLSGVKKAAKQAVASGARKVAKGALSVARKMEAGDKMPSPAHTKTRKAAIYRGASVGTKEKVSSGSYMPSTKKKASTRKKNSKLDDLLADIRKEAKEVTALGSRLIDTYDKAPYSDDEASPKDSAKMVRKAPKMKNVVKKEEFELNEKTLSSAESKKKEEIVKSMKDKAADFEKRYPGRGKEVMYATATKMAKKMAEQAMELQPKAQQSSQPQKTDQQQKKLQQQQDRMRQQEVQIIQRKLQTLRSAPKGSDPSIMA
jgi:hypothetical protein